jgi:hypothetical protein
VFSSSPHHKRCGLCYCLGMGLKWKYLPLPFYVTSPYCRENFFQDEAVESECPAALSLYSNLPDGEYKIRVGGRKLQTFYRDTGRWYTYKGKVQFEQSKDIDWLNFPDEPRRFESLSKIKLKDRSAQASMFVEYWKRFLELRDIRKDTTSWRLKSLKSDY